MNIKSIILSAAISLSLLLSGCAAPALTEQSGKKVEATNNDSVITFYRTPNIFAMFERPVIIEKTNSDIILIGTLDTNTKLQYKTTPGKHYFGIITKEYAQILTANLDSGKSYYSHSVPWMGILHYNLKLIPDREAESLNAILETSKTKNSTLTQQGREWFSENKEKLQDTINSVFSSYEEDEQYTIFPEDGHIFSMDPNITIYK